jgi:hypothetical protein
LEKIDGEKALAKSLARMEARAKKPKRPPRHKYNPDVIRKLPLTRFSYFDADYDERGLGDVEYEEIGDMLASGDFVEIDEYHGIGADRLNTYQEPQATRATTLEPEPTPWQKFWKALRAATEKIPCLTRNKIYSTISYASASHPSYFRFHHDLVMASDYKEETADDIVTMIKEHGLELWDTPPPIDTPTLEQREDELELNLIAMAFEPTTPPHEAANAKEKLMRLRERQKERREKLDAGVQVT